MTKSEDFSGWYHKILEDAGIVDSRYPIKGMLVYRKWGLFIIREMQRCLEGMLEGCGHEPTLFPVLISEDTLGRETEHIAGFEEQVFWVTHAGNNELERRLALRPTSETPMYEMFSIWVRSHTDLPLKVYQSCAVYRYETKHTRPLIRGREFLWNEGHSAHADAEDAGDNIKEIHGIYSRLIKDLLCIPFIVNTRPEWDRFPGAVETYAFDTLMPDGKTLQIATMHNLGQNFSRVFDIKYETVTGDHEYAYQTSYGPSFGRLLAAVICIHGDDKGLVLPPKIAPMQAIIIPIVFKESDKEEIMQYAGDLEGRLRSLGVRVGVDAGEERPGAKFYHWEMKGVPLRLEIGPRDLRERKVTVVRRDNGGKSQIGFEELDKIGGIFDDMSRNLREKAEREFEKRLFRVERLEDVDRYVGEGIVSLGWCNGKECAGQIEEHASVLCANKNPARCIICNAPGREVRVAKTY